MIYILFGNDIKSRNAYLKKVYKDNKLIFFDFKDSFDKKDILEKARSVSLFGEKPVVVLEGVLNDKKFSLEDKDFSILKSSESIFVFLEDKLNQSEFKKFNKLAEIVEFNKNELKKISSNNIFNIADYFSRKDKINTWILYREAILNGVSPEEICGIIFWKMKDMILKGSKIFLKEEIIDLSSKLLSIYHLSHKGEIDFVISLEQFILSSLNKIKKA